uniref:ARAD1D34122p n=1 Tax=Blastobotrys adeninivorans TaxID=409370 RepID=A0A060TBR6_BLAAD
MLGLRALNRYSLQFKLGVRPYSDVRSWLSGLTVDSIPKHEFHVGFSRSSGPGGQNVNKVNTKATIRLSKHQWEDAEWIPSEAKRQLNNGFPYLTKSGAIVVQSELTRNRSDNLQDCYEKFVRAIKDVVYVAPEAQQEDIERWESIHKKSKERRLETKKQLKNKKQSRRKDWDSDY